MPLDNIKCEALFNLIEKIGVVLEGEIHILDITKDSKAKTYRVYTHDYSCFDISKYLPIEQVGEVSEELIPFGVVWQDHMKPLTVNYAYMLVAALHMERSEGEERRE